MGKPKPATEKKPLHATPLRSIIKTENSRPQHLKSLQWSPALKQFKTIEPIKNKARPRIPDGGILINSYGGKVETDEKDVTCSTCSLEFSSVKDGEGTEQCGACHSCYHADCHRILLRSESRKRAAGVEITRIWLCKQCQEVINKTHRYCYCRKWLDNGSYVECERCLDLFHVACTWLGSDEEADRVEHFVCNSCARETARPDSELLTLEEADALKTVFDKLQAHRNSWVFKWNKQGQPTPGIRGLQAILFEAIKNTKTEEDYNKVWYTSVNRKQFYKKITRMFTHAEELYKEVELHSILVEAMLHHYRDLYKSIVEPQLDEFSQASRAD